MAVIDLSTSLRQEETDMNSTVIAIDLAKDVFEVAVSHVPGQVSQRRRISRAKLQEWIATVPAATVLLEACGTAHYWARFISGLGHKVVLIPPHVVRRYVAGNKTDRTDTKALLEAYRNEEIHPVPMKSEAQQGVMSLHRLRSGWMGTRTARMNEVRGLLREFGLTIPLGADRFLERATAIIHKETSPLPLPLRTALEAALKELLELDERIDAVDKSIGRVARETPMVKLLQTIPGVGILTATAAAASLVDFHRYKSGRQLASSLGLTPREHSSGNRRFLGRITKRGDRYLRTNLVHGSRSVLRAAKKKANPSRLEAWALELERTIGHNKAAVALANKQARLLWVVATRGVPYQPKTV